MLEYKKTRGYKSKRPEIEVLDELYRTHTAKQIAKKYGVAESTVKGWISHYRKKLQVEVNTNA